MKEITKQYATENNLKQLGIIKDMDMSKIILKLERLKENKDIKYYCVNFIVYEQAKDEGNIEVSLWGN
jgi:hypothetical protein